MASKCLICISSLGLFWLVSTLNQIRILHPFPVWEFLNELIKKNYIAINCVLSYEIGN